MSKKKRVAIDDRIMVLASSSSEKTHLVGGACPHCGEVVFPKRDSCPKCTKMGMTVIPLSTQGEVYASTVVHFKPPLYEGPIPYVVGEVLVPEGAVVQTAFIGCDMDKPLPIGTRVELVIEKIGEDEAGNELMVHKFRPV